MILVFYFVNYIFANYIFCIGKEFVLCSIIIIGLLLVSDRAYAEGMVIISKRLALTNARRDIAICRGYCISLQQQQGVVTSIPPTDTLATGIKKFSYSIP